MGQCWILHVSHIQSSAAHTAAGTSYASTCFVQPENSFGV